MLCVAGKGSFKLLVSKFGMVKGHHCRKLRKFIMVRVIIVGSGNFVNLGCGKDGCYIETRN